MSNRSHRRFRPTVDGFRLEDRLVLSTAPVTTAAVGDPPSLVLTTKSVGATLNLLGEEFKSFQSKYNRAAQHAITSLANGQVEANLVSSLQAYASLEGGVLQTQLAKVSQRLPYGQTYLYLPPSGAISGQQSYVPAAQRIQTQVNTMISGLTSPSITTVQQACSQSLIQSISQTYLGVRAAGNQYIQMSNTNSNFTVIGLQATT